MKRRLVVICVTLIMALSAATLIIPEGISHHGIVSLYGDKASPANYRTNVEMLNSNQSRIEAVSFKADTDVSDASFDEYTKHPKYEHNLLTIFYPDDRERIYDTTSYPWSTICKIYSYHPGSEYYCIGSGVMIDESHVLTAGHVTYLHEEDGWPYDSWASSIKVVPGMNNGYGPFGHSWVTYAQSTTGWTDLHMSEHDWALLTLDTDMGYDTGWLGRQTASYTNSIYTGTLNTAGYPSDLDDGENMYYCSGEGDSADEYFHYFYLDAYPGQSGSPVWRYDGEDRYVLSILTQEADSYNRGVRLNQEKYDRLSDWLADDSPTLSYSPSYHDFGDMTDGQTNSTTFEIWNSGAGTLTYSLDTACNWLDVNPDSGSSTGEHDTITVSVDTTGLSQDSHTGSISIDSDGGNDVFSVEVNVVQQQKPSTTYVDDDFDPSVSGWQYDHFDVIQDGIDAVAENGEVYIKNGTYNENVVVDKTVALIGENRQGTIIDGDGGRCIWLKANGINVSHFSIRNSTNGGIVIDSDYNHIFCCNIFDQKQAIGAGYTSHNKIINCEVYNCSTGAGAIGLAWDNHYTEIKNCSVHDNAGHGIKSTTPSSHISVINCSFYRNAKGVVLQDTSDSLVKNCRIYNNTGEYGLGLGHWSGSGGTGVNNIVEHNIIANNSNHGIKLQKDHSGIIRNNSIESNTGYAVYIEPDCESNTIYHNNFIDNNAGGIQGHDAGSDNIWYNGTPQEGNYWSDYNGTDTNGDDIGDEPYNIAGGVNNQDLYPLLYPYGPPHAAFKYSTTEKEVEFNASLSGDYDGTIISYNWDFGDGTNETGENVMHNYSEFGEYNVTLEVVDDSGNHGGISKRVFVNDTIPPVISNVQAFPIEQESGRYVNISFNASDNAAIDTIEINVSFPDGSHEKWRIGGQHYLNITYFQVGTYHYSIWANDTSGNVVSSALYSFEIQDTIQPTSHVNTMGSYWQESTPFSIDVTANDSGSGVSSVKLFYKYSEDNQSWGTWTSFEIDSAYPYRWSFNSTLPNGYYRFYSIATDEAGNTEDSPQLFDMSVGVDTTSPTSSILLSGTVGNHNWYISPVEVTINRTDNVSGINHTKYDIDGEEWIDYTSPFTYAEEGSHTFSFYSVDNAGNAGTVNSTSFKIDTNPPKTTLAYDTLEENLSISLTASDDTSGVNQTQYAINDANWHTYTQPFTISRTQNHSIYYTSIDNASNAEETHLLNLIHPIASFEWSPAIPNVSQTIEFTDYSNDEDGDIVNYTWNLGDGNISYEQNPQHTYTRYGDYTISLTVTDNDNMTNTIQKTITVNKIPVSNFSYNPSSPKTDATITFDGSTSTDIDGTIAEYKWDWDNDGIFDTSRASATATHSWNDNGAYNVTLKVTDDKGANDTKTQTITVANRAPMMGFSFSPQNPKPGESISFASSCYDQDGSIVAYDWNLGISTLSATNPMCTYQNSGVYTISLTVEDDDGATDTISRTINVNEPPTADFTYSPSNPTDLQTIFFTDSSTDVDGALSSYNWNFGDGNTSHSQSPNHTYSDDGTYTVTLTIQDDDGSTDVISHEISVNNVKPIVNFSYTPQSPVKVDTMLNFTDNSSDSDGTIKNCTWTFGDGTTGYGQTPNHTYTAPGTYNVTLTVTDDDGDTDTSTITIIVEEQEGIPGFELALLVMAIATILFVKRRRKNGPV